MKAVVHVDMGATELSARARRGRRLLWEETIGLDAETEGVATVVGAIRERHPLPTDAAIELRLHPPLVQLRALDGIPPVSQRDLVSLVRRQAARYFRRTGDALVVDAAWVDGRRGRRRVAHAAAISESLAERLTAAVRDAGLDLIKMGAAAAAYRHLDLAPPSIRRQVRGSHVQRLRFWGALAACAWLTAGSVYILKLGRLGARTRMELEAVAEPLEALRRVRREMATLEASRDLVLSSRAASGVAIASLYEASRALPDSAHLSSFEFEAPGQVRVTGVAPRARRYVARLEESGGLPQVALDGDPIRLAVGGAHRERFTIRVERAAP